MRDQDGYLEKVTFTDRTDIERSGGIVTSELAQSHSFISSLGCDTEHNGVILVDELGTTSVEGAAYPSSIRNPSSHCINSDLTWTCSDNRKALKNEGFSYITNY
ncbi:hypothetical protein [Terribacillus sp. JSM ZJ617]|uniref:hypothetical protein n=1 Tax=Terribacillus sp. JSM ZJ617 TaxID=3342119 RepID=UPI0035A97D4D